MIIPKIDISKNKVPIIYLDTCALIELSRYEKAICKNAHADEIGKLYNTLTAMMREGRVLCAFGNQLEEMGASQKRADAREFLFRFTNIEFVSPYQIEKRQLNIGYRAFVENKPDIAFSTTGIVDETVRCRNSSIEVHAVPIYPQDKTEKLKQDKQKLAASLNEVKQNGNIAKSYDEQLEVELKSDFQVFLYFLEHGRDSAECYMNMLDALNAVYRRVGIAIDAPDNEKIKAVDSHNRFLLSSYHHNLPYVWAQSALFAHIMLRSKKVTSSDRLDILWASAYLPFVDYAVTDTSFCDLLNASGIAEKYKTKVYCFGTINNLLDEI